MFPLATAFNTCERGIFDAVFLVFENKFTNRSPYRLSQTTSSATTSSSEGRGRRETSPEHDRRDLRLPDLDRSLPVYDVQYGVSKTKNIRFIH